MFDYDAFYKTQSVSFCDYPERHAKIASLCRGKVFDIGCCFGIFSDYYFGDYVGFDISKHVITEAKKVRRPDAKFLVHDCSDLSGIDIASCDTFVFANFLEHFKDDDKIFGPIFSRHKKGARIVVCLPNADRIPDPSHLRTLTIPELRKKFSPHGKVKFYNWFGAVKHIICTVDLDEKNTDDLSLAMIVKNEEKGLEKAVFSCLEFVDNIVISVDSKSTDNTAKIAKLYADTYKTHIWQDNFSQTRNEAYQGIKTKWILYLDGHEYIAKFDGFDQFADSKLDGLMCAVQLESGMTFRYPRVFKAGLQFEGQVHNKISLRSSAHFPGILIKHDRLSSQSRAAIAERKAQQDDMIPRIMGAELRENPKNARASFHLALHYQSRKNYKKALKYQKIYLRYSKNRGERWAVYFNRALCNLSLRRHFFALWNVDKADAEVPNRWETAKLKGIIYCAVKDYKKALGYLVDSFKINTGEFSYNPWLRNDSATWNLVAECFFNLGNYDKAGTAFARAADICDDKIASKFFQDRAKLMTQIYISQFKK